MNAKWLAAFAAISILLPGCLLHEPAPLNESGLLPPQPNYTPPAGDQFLSYDDMSLEGLRSAPIMCTVSGIPNAENLTIYMQGSNVRSEYYDAQTESLYVTIMKNDLYYISGGQNNTPFQNCSWVFFNKTSFKQSGYDSQSPYGARVPNYTSIPGGPDMPRCRPGNFGSEIFAVNGTVCDYGLLISQAVSSGFDCSAISDPGEREMCELYYDKNSTG